MINYVTSGQNGIWVKFYHHGHKDEDKKWAKKLKFLHAEAIFL